jgi:hypothetical protein
MLQSGSEHSSGKVGEGSSYEAHCATRTVSTVIRSAKEFCCHIFFFNLFTKKLTYHFYFLTQFSANTFLICTQNIELHFAFILCLSLTPDSDKFLPCSQFSKHMSFRFTFDKMLQLFFSIVDEEGG